MLIANPIYDTIFKYLMEDLRVAKRLLSVIIGEEILEVETRTQEHTFRSAMIDLTVLRMDFVAIILTKEGKRKKVLIELQKGKQPIDITRFRRYLAQGYLKPEALYGEMADFPIVTIYFLGFKLSLHESVLKVGRFYQNPASGRIVEGKDEFIEKLTHDCFVVQIPFLPKKTQNKLEKVLSVFNQEWVKDEKNNWIMNYKGEQDDEDLQVLLERLHTAVADEELIEQIQAEEEFENSIDKWRREHQEELETRDKKLEEKGKQLEEKGKQLEEKGKQLEEKGKQLEEKGKKLKEEKQKSDEKDKKLVEIQQEMEALKRQLEHLSKKS